MRLNKIWGVILMILGSSFTYLLYLTFTEDTNRIIQAVFMLACFLFGLRLYKSKD